MGRLRLLEHSALGTTARAAAELVRVSRNTVNRFYLALRRIIAEEMEKAAPLHGEVEVDESYSGSKRKVKRGRGAAGKVPVFGLSKHSRRAYTPPLPNAKAKTLMPILESRVVPSVIVYTDSFASYDVIDVSTFHHRRIDHGKAFVAVRDRKRHINGIENFWNQAKRHLRRYNGIPRKSFYYFLKECEWRFNGGNHEVHRGLLGWARREGVLK